MRSLQARGKPEEASREVRALLNVLRENEEEMQSMAAMCAEQLELVSEYLTILDPKVGEEELIKAVAAALAKLRMP